MTESGSGQRDDRYPRPDEGGGSGDDYTPSASWETSRGSSWENTTPYESPWAAPSSSGTAASEASAADRAAEDGPWPTYPEQDPQDHQPYGEGHQQPTQGDGAQPSSYPSAGDPYPGYGQPPLPDYGAQTAYTDPGSYLQQPAYGQQPGYGQQPAYGVNPYQQPMYGYLPPNHPQATTALILGIVGLALCPFVGIAGFVMGGRIRREIDAAPGQWGGRGLATAGWVLGIISIVYVALILAYIVGIAVVAVASS
jgi:hypothetical protein